MNIVVNKIAFIKDVELEIEIEEVPELSNEESDVFLIDDVISALHDRNRDEDKPVLEELKKLKASDVDLVAIDKVEF